MTADRPTLRLLDFESDELKWILIFAFVFAFVLTFRMWGPDDTFDPAYGLTNLLIGFAGMTVLVFLHEGGHKIAGARESYAVRIVPFKPGLAISGFVALYSQGIVPLVTPNLVECDAKTHLRLGKFRKYDNPSNMARIAMGGIIGSVLGVMAFKVLYNLTGFELLRVIMLGGVLHALYSLIPWELLNLFKLRYFESAETYAPGDGLHILWWSRGFYVFFFAFVIIFGLVTLLTGWVSVYIVIALAAAATYALNKALGLD